MAGWRRGSAYGCAFELARGRALIERERHTADRQDEKRCREQAVEAGGVRLRRHRANQPYCTESSKRVRPKNS
jgi:hypothetical protein